MTEAMPKVTAQLQTTGEAQYTNDIPHMDGELYAAFVLTTVANANIDKIDTSKAMVSPISH